MLKDFVATESLQTENFCGGCGAAIRDRYYLLAADQAWHGQCLRCCKCSQPLDSELSCYSRDDNIYCKEDYYRLFSSKRCGGCGKGLRSSELVMRARDLVFHVNCFSCSLCGIRLSAGDTAAISCGRLLCGEHYDGEISSEENSISTAGPFYSNSPQKGRPRKRNLSSADHSDESHDTNAKDSTSMRTEFLHGDFASSSFSLTSYEDSQSPGSSSNLSGQGRTKRMRTSFKHHQLRTMKSYFSINQNPDAKDLKQLAQKTGLSKRVLQVWFQNARAKWRRNVMLREVNQTQPSSSGSILPNDTTLTSNFTSSTDTSQTQDLESIHHMTFGKLY